MLPSFSSSSLGSQRRQKHAAAGNFHRNRPPVTRSSTIFGTLKSIVTAPFSWLSANNEDFAEEKDDQGKRRRVAGGERTNTITNGDATLEDSGDVDEGITRGTKRLRMSSPLRRDHQLAALRVGYNDPPESSFSTNAYVPPNRSASVALPSTTIRPTADNSVGRRYARSPMRASSLALQPSISMDSQSSTVPKPIQRDVSMSGLPSPRDTSMEPGTFAHVQGQAHTTAPPLTRDLSLPPSSSRPPFVLRSSLTPQPTQQLLPLVSASALRRDASEPPPISSLRQHPVFVRGPPKTEGVHLPSDSVTLGTLVENHRSSRSPTRSHSLLFASHSQDLTSSLNTVSSQAQLTPAQKALHALDIYKTPLVPTRLRSSTPSHGPFDINSLINGSISSSGGPDLFKKRNPLLLMNDREHRGRRRKDRDAHKTDRKGKSRDINETKPYAGSGGMKKLLARARAAAADETGEADHREIDEARMQVDRKQAKVEVDEGVQTEEAPLPSIPKSDWYSIASQSSTTPAPSVGSSLRVGRSKISRNHIARPSVPAARRATKFSAVYEDDAMEGDDDTKGPRDDVVGDVDEQRRQPELKELEEAAKNAPIFKPPPSFSFANEGPPPVQADVNAEEPPIASLPFSFAKPASEPVIQAPAPVVAKEAAAPVAPSFTRATPALTPPMQAETVTVTQGFSFKATELPVPSATVIDASTEAKAEPAKGGIPNFFTNSSLVSKPLTPPVASFSFSPAPPATETAPVLAKADPKPTFSLPSGFSFNKPNDTKVATTSTTEDSSSNPFFPPASTEAISESKSSGNVSVAPASSSGLFGASSPPSASVPFPFPKMAETKDESKPLMFSFGSSKDKVDSAPAPPPLFGNTPFASSGAATDSSTKKPFAALSTEAPKPLFGGQSSGTTNFGFGPSTDAKTSAPPAAPAFSFTGNLTAEEKKPSFSFSQNTPVAPVAQGFSFGPSGSAGTDVSNKPFSFGTIQRPSTPPKLVNDENEMRMEESPTREPTQQNRDLPKPTLNFSFNNGSTPSTLFGAGSSTTTNPFSFGSSSTPFGNKADTAAPAELAKPSFTFAQPANTNATPFSFGSTINDTSRPTSAGAFNFGTASTPTSATTTTTPFTFAQPGSSAPAANPFATAGTSAPSSPSTFSQTPAFTFGLSASGQAPTPTSPAAPFKFGSSQPASPAAGTSTLPVIGGFGGTSPASPFGASAAGTAPLFTMGSAPTNTTPTSARQFKKLPTRRGGKR